MRGVVVLCMMGAALSMAAMPLAYWKNLAHGVNSRSLYTPGKQGAWSAELKKLNCSLPAFSVPFDSMTTYGPSGVNPIDGSVVVGLKCYQGTTQLPYLWIVQQSGAQRLVEIVSSPCASQLREADVFEGYLNFLPDGGVIFGLCSNVYVLPLGSSTLRNLGSYGYSPSIISVINSEPAQMIIAGGRWDRWWEDWGAVAVNIAGVSSTTITLTNSIAIDDTTIMFSPDGKTMYNGHFDQWAPGTTYGLQYWSTPFTTSSVPKTNFGPCAQTRPWTYSADSQGNVYSSLCGGSLLMKIDKEGNQVWNVTCPGSADCGNVERQQVFMTDDERYVYVGSTRLNYYTTGQYFVVDSREGTIVKTMNITRLAQEGKSCQAIYGPFASRWPVPLVGKTRALFQCTVSTNVTTVYSFDPMAKNFGLKKYSNINAFAPILLTDGSDNAYVIGIDNQHAFVRRFPA